MNITEKIRRKIIKTLAKYRSFSSTSKCFGWTGTVREKRNPSIYINGSGIGAHRAAWILSHGKIPENKFVRHSCDNPICTNPDHLYLSDKRRNVRSTYKRVGRERLSVDLPIELVTNIKKMADKYNQTVTKYVLKRLSEAIEYEKNIDKENPLK